MMHYIQLRGSSLLNIMHEHQEEQGFFSEHIEIKQASAYNCKSPSLQARTQFKKSPFETKVLPWSGLFKKEPTEVFNTKISLNNNSNEPTERKKNKPGNKDHPYKMFASNPNYQLIYNRINGDPISSGVAFLRNQVKLEHIGSSEPIQFKKIKGFDENNETIRPGVLQLDSRFECGNLHCAYKHQKNQEYILFVQNDTNSLGYNQWFYFSVQNIQADTKYTIRLMNFKKKHSFFKYGCKPAVFSLAQYHKSGVGWSRRGENIVYQQSSIHIPERPELKFYSLTFDITFDQQNDYVLIAMGLPYSYSKLINFLKQAEKKAEQIPELKFSISSVSRTICGNDVPEVIISRDSQVENKKNIIFMARQHPGQIWSSYMMEGVIKRLVNSENDPEMIWLLENYTIIIYPMINVDGVIYGNFRCDITGVDLNRRWKDTPRLLHPQVYDIKRKINYHRAKAKVDCVFDLHGHSKNYNIFAYSCRDNAYTCRILPYLINQRNPVFYFPSCTFGISKYKQSTARAAIYKIIKNENVLTIESSFYGSKLNGVVKQFVPEDLYKMADNILDSTRLFVDKKGKVYLNAKKQIESRIKQFMKYDQVNENQSGSDSDPSGDQIDLETKITQIFNQTFVTREALHLPKKNEQQSISPRKSFMSQQNKTEAEVKKKEDVKKKNPPINPHIIMDNIPIPKKTTIDHDSRFRVSETKKILKNRGKQTISYSDQKYYEQSPLPPKPKEQLTRSKGAFREKYKRVAPNIKEYQPKSQREIQNRRPRLSSQTMAEKPSVEFVDYPTEQPKQPLEETPKSQDFVKKFERFIPASMSNKNRNSMSMFEESIYNEDQSNLISMLLENKRKIELQKIKRDQSDRGKSRCQDERKRWSISAHSNRMRRLIKKSDNNLAMIVCHTFEEPPSPL